MNLNPISSSPTAQQPPQPRCRHSLGWRPACYGAAQSLAPQTARGRALPRGPCPPQVLTGPTSLIFLLSQLHWWLGAQSRTHRHWGSWQVGATPRTGGETTGSLHSLEWVNAAGGESASASPWHGWKPAMTTGEEGFVPPWHQLRAGPQDQRLPRQVFRRFL